MKDLTETLRLRHASNRTKRNAPHSKPVHELNEFDESSHDEQVETSFPSSISSGEKPPRLGEAVLYGPAGDVVRTILPHTEADPAALYAQLLCGLGNLIGQSPHFTADGQKHSANLYTIICGRTSKARKGTSWANVRNVLGAIDTDWLASCVRSGVVSGEGVAEVFRDESEKRLLLIEGEFCQVLQCMKREGNTVSALLRNAWDGGRISVLRRKDKIEIEGAHMSMIGHITLPELQRLLSCVEMSNGLANRCLWVYADRSKLLPDGGGHPDLSSHVKALHRAVEHARKRNELRKDESARAFWNHIYTELSEPPSGRVGEILSRSEAQVMRLALLLALLDQSPVIAKPHVEAALAFWRYCEASAAHIFADTFANPKAEKILKALKSGPLTMTQIHALFNRNFSSREINALLEETGPKIIVEKKGNVQVIRLR